MAVRHVGANVGEREKFFGQLANGLHDGPAHFPSDRQQAYGDLRGQTGRDRVPIDARPVLGKCETDGNEHAESAQRQQPASVVSGVEQYVREERREKNA